MNRLSATLSENKLFYSNRLWDMLCVCFGFKYSGITVCFVFGYLGLFGFALDSGVVVMVKSHR